MNNCCTPRERILMAMDKTRPDKVPLMCQFSWGFMLKNLKFDPINYWFDSATYAEGLITLRENYNFDGILISLYGHDENWKTKLQNINKENGITKANYQNGVY